MSYDSVIDPIVAALRSGELREAESYCRSALTRDPDIPDVWLLLGLALQRQGRSSEALAPFARLTELCPQDDSHWSNYATALYRVGDFDAAREAIKKALDLAPNEPERLEQLGLLSLELGAPRTARTALLRALEQSPDSPGLRIHATRASVACNDLSAGDLLRPWREWQPLSDELQLELADLLTQVSEQWDALEILEGLAKRKPTDWAVQLLLAKVQERVNQPDRAAATLDWIDAMYARSAENAWIGRELGIQRSQLAMRRHEYAAAKTLLVQAVSPDHEDAAGYYFALARACDGAGDPADAMTALETAHRLQVEDLRTSNPHLLETGAPLLPGVDIRVSEADYRNWPVLRAPDADQSPVFIVGFPRSGTTLLEQMLDAHPRLQSMDERPFLNILAGQLHGIGIDVPEDLAKLGQRDCDELRKGYVLMGCEKIARRWDARLVDKNPLNMLWLPMLHRLFPHAKVILALRHPCDVIWSCYLQNFRSASLAAACRSLDHLAQAYVAAMQNWLHHAEVFHPDVLVSRYEDLVAEPSVHARRIAEFLALENSEAMLDFVARAQEKGFIKTPSYTQVIEPINARGVGHWHRYRKYFEGVLPVVKPMLEQWGYDVSAKPAMAAT